LLENAAREPLRRHLIQRNFSSADSFAQIRPPMAYGGRRTVDLNARSEGIFRKGAFFFLWILLFVMPWENAVVIHGFGTISRAAGIPAFAMALLAILETGTLRMLAPQQLIMVIFLIWGGFTYFWSFDPTSTVTSIYTFVQLFMMVWLIWEFAQRRKQQILLLRAYVLGSIISSVATLLGFFNKTGLQSGRYSGLGFNPGDLAFILALAIPISLYLAVHEQKQILVWVDGAATVLAFCAIVLTASRGSLVACIPTILMFPFLFPKLRWGRNLIALVFVALAGIGSWLFMPESSWSRLSTIGSEVTSGTLNERTMIWQIGWQVFGQVPFQGVGAGAYAPTIEHTLGLASDVGSTETCSQVARLVAHNTFFSVLVEQGVIGFTLFLALLLTLVLSAWMLPRVDRIFWLCILLTWGIGALDLTWEQRKPTWFIFGLLISVAATKMAAQRRLARRDISPMLQPELF
jgi:O-antigen ligase